MDTKKKRSGGFGSIFFMIIIIGIVWAVIAQMSQRTSNYKYKDFESDLKSGRITDVVISQNAEVPTKSIALDLNSVGRASFTPVASHSDPLYMYFWKKIYILKVFACLIPFTFPIDQLF